MTEPDGGGFTWGDLGMVALALLLVVALLVAMAYVPQLQPHRVPTASPAALAPGDCGTVGFRCPPHIGCSNGVCLTTGGL